MVYFAVAYVNIGWRRSRVLLCGYDFHKYS
jgi:hypothetical protein